jgi:hypothetical protein
VDFDPHQESASSNWKVGSDSIRTMGLSNQERYMAKFRIGDVVSTDAGQAGIIRAIFATIEGEPRYAVENDGALDFVCESRLSPQPAATMAA